MSAERVCKIVVPTTRKGAYSFEKYQDPYAMAIAFGTAPQAGEVDQGFSGLALTLNSFQWLLTDDDLLAQTLTPLKEALDRVRRQTQNQQAAEILASSFGEVELNDRDNLGILAVFNALKHNIEEATQRKTDELNQLIELITAMQQIIADLNQEIEKKMALIAEQQLVDTEAQQKFAHNSANGYSANASIGNKGVTFSEKLLTKDEQELQLLKNQQSMLNSLLFFLSLNLWIQ